MNGDLASELETAFAVFRLGDGKAGTFKGVAELPPPAGAGFRSVARASTDGTDVGAASGFPWWAGAKRASVMPALPNVATTLPP